jgi:anti-sigma B factor antagonist
LCNFKPNKIKAKIKTMDFSYEIKDNVLFVVAEGDLLGLQNDVKLLEFISHELKEDVIYCVIDISNINYMNSSGLSMLIRILTKFRNKDGDIALVNPSDSVSKLLVITKLNAIFAIAKSKESALEILLNNAQEENKVFV